MLAAKRTPVPCLFCMADNEILTEILGRLLWVEYESFIDITNRFWVGCFSDFMGRDVKAQFFACKMATE
jgi:hypothetical protein